MSHKVFGNMAYTDDGWTAVWKLTRVMKAAGWTYKASGDGSSKDTTGVAANDKWGGAGDPMSDTMPSLGTGSWWCARGPSTLKIPIGATTPTGTFIRGEKVTQATSLAEGELLGIVTDTAGSGGYLVVAPRTGTFDSSNVITGAFSAATITPTATIITFIREVVFWRSSTSTSQGTWYYQCLDDVGESASVFSYIAGTAAGCTASVCPGGGGTGNSFPSAGTMACIGTGGSDSPKNWTCWDNAVARGKSHLICANNTPATGVSADGSFMFLMGIPGDSSSSYCGFGLQRLDDTEDGDVDPYIVYAPNSVTYGSGSRTAQTTAMFNTPQCRNFFWSHGCMSCAAGYVHSYWKGWRRRGYSSGDAWVEYVGGFIAYSQGNAASQCELMGYGQNVDARKGEAEAVACHPVANIRVREPIWIISTLAGKKHRKGTLRWMYWVPGGGGSNGYDTLQWFQIGYSYPGYPGGYGVIIGPWDGTTVPVNG